MKLEDFTHRWVPLSSVLTLYRDGDERGWGVEFALLWDTQQEYMDGLMEKIKIHGFNMPILLGSDGRVWDGHHRLAVAHRIGLESVPVEFSGEESK